MKRITSRLAQNLGMTIFFRLEASSSSIHPDNSAFEVSWAGAALRYANLTEFALMTALSRRFRTPEWPSHRERPRG